MECISSEDHWRERDNLKHIPIADQELRPIGAINARQAVQALLDEVGNEELLRDYVLGVGYR